MDTRTRKDLTPEVLVLAVIIVFVSLALQQALTDLPAIPLPQWAQWDSAEKQETPPREIDQEILPGQYLVIFGVATAAVAIVLVVRRARQGHGDFHINQFRIYFTFPGNPIEPSTLSEKLLNNFEKCFASNAIARVEPSRSKSFARFRAVIRRAKPFAWLFQKERLDYVRLSRPDNHPHVFQARTSASNDASNVDWHFLAGIRSWHVGRGSSLGEPVCSSENAYFLETAAFERFSSFIYSIPIGRGLIANCWRDFLRDALDHLGTQVTPIAAEPAPDQRKYRLGGKLWKKRNVRRGNMPKISIWERHCKISRKQLSSLKTQAYTARLFMLHPGIEDEYSDALDK